ncbi:hypothetical protein QN277_025923 [Acacia crassicarpa]|uniref:BAG domain-containing protein n=1 Tax=Acacia crassicarpa TaxID=499986 RepID=A0AAE1JA74_9FABA|nr:hypothetical protein QN277_025923 [Acacia crassicarpa]
MVNKLGYKLSERVAALEVAMNGATKVSEKEFLISTELLMRQLLKLDSIEAEGVAKLQRNAEVVFPNLKFLLFAIDVFFLSMQSLISYMVM